MFIQLVIGVKWVKMLLWIMIMIIWHECVYPGHSRHYGGQISIISVQYMKYWKIVIKSNIQNICKYKQLYLRKKKYAIFCFWHPFLIPCGSVRPTEAEEETRDVLGAQLLTVLHRWREQKSYVWSRKVHII